MAPRPGHKRAGSSDGGPSAHAPKKTRFVEPQDDPANFAEEVDAQLEDPSAKRKGRVRTEGYDSDSSDDGEGVVLSRKPGAGGAEEEEEDDMFAMGEKEEKKAQEGEGKKKEEFMRLGDIEGQEFEEQDGSDDEDEEDAPEDEDDAERRKKAGMGFELSSFNMREEMEEGKFSADGMYVRTFDPHAVHDKWMDGLDDDEIKKARKQHKHRQRIQREKQKAEERELEQLGGKEEMEQAILSYLKKGETVLEALQRIGAKAKKNSAAHKKKPNNKTKRLAEEYSMQVDAAPKAPAAPSDIENLTHLASNLMSFGDTDVYSKTYEELARDVRRSGKVDKDWIAPSADVKYEYKWDVPGADDGQVFGPFSEEEMQTWHKAAYFGVAGEKIKIRATGGDWGAWDDVVT